MWESYRQKRYTCCQFIWNNRLDGQKKTGEGKQRFGPMYVYSKEECLKGYSELFYAPGDRFDISKVKIDEKTKSMLKKEDIEFLSGLGIY